MYERVVSILHGAIMYAHACFTDSQKMSLEDDYSESHQAKICLYCIFLFHRSLDINGYLGVAILTSLCPLLLRRGSLPKSDLSAIPALLFRKGFSVCPDTVQADATSQALKPIIQLTSLPFELVSYSMCTVCRT